MGPKGAPHHTQPPARNAPEKPGPPHHKGFRAFLLSAADRGNPFQSMRRWGYIKGYPTAPTEAIPPMPLTDAAIRRAKPQKITDGGGLYLYLTPPDARSGRWKYRIAGKEKLLSIGL